TLEVQGGGAGKRFKRHGFHWQVDKLRFLGVDRLLGHQACGAPVKPWVRRQRSQRRRTWSTERRRAGCCAEQATGEGPCLRNAHGGRVGVAAEREQRDILFLFAGVPREI